MPKKKDNTPKKSVKHPSKTHMGKVIRQQNKRIGVKTKGK